MSIRSCRPLPKHREEPANDVPGQPRPAVRHATTIWGTLGGLPADLIDKAVSRLGLFGLLSAAAHPFFHFGMRVVLPAEILRAMHMPERTTAGTHREAQEGVLQANAQAN